MPCANCVGDQAATSMDEAVYAATLGDVALADRSVERAFAEGLAAVGLLRGRAGATWCGCTRPAAGWRQAPRPATPWTACARRCSGNASRTWCALGRAPGRKPRIEAALAEVRRAELACKQTGSPDGVIARRLVLALARQSATRGR